VVETGFPEVGLAFGGEVAEAVDVAEVVATVVVAVVVVAVDEAAAEEEEEAATDRVEEGFCWNTPPDWVVGVGVALTTLLVVEDGAATEVDVGPAAEDEAEDPEPPLGGAPPLVPVSVPIVPSLQPLEVPVQPVSLLARSEA